MLRSDVNLSTIILLRTLPWTSLSQYAGYADQIGTISWASGSRWERRGEGWSDEQALKPKRLQNLCWNYSQMFDRYQRCLCRTGLQCHKTCWHVINHASPSVSTNGWRSVYWARLSLATAHQFVSLPDENWTIIRRASYDVIFFYIEKKRERNAGNKRHE